MAKQTEIMGKIISLIFAIYIIAYAVNGAVLALTNSTVYVPATQATGTAVFSGNVSNGELVNITSGTAVYLFEFNTTAGSTIICQTTNCIPVNLTKATGGTWNQSVYASGNLTAAINGNASTAALVTAVNTTNITTLTAVNPGVIGNSITLSDNTANVVSSGLSGGLAGHGFATNNPIATLLSTLIAIIIVIGIAWVVYRHMQVK